MKIKHYYIKDAEEVTSETGLTVSVTFDNPTTKEAFEEMFALRKSEELAGVIITEQGITAILKYKD